MHIFSSNLVLVYATFAGSMVRIDTTLLGFDNSKWERGSRSYVFKLEGKYPRFTRTIDYSCWYVAGELLSTHVLYPLMFSLCSSLSKWCSPQQIWRHVGLQLHVGVFLCHNVLVFNIHGVVWITSVHCSWPSHKTSCCKSPVYFNSFLFSISAAILHDLFPLCLTSNSLSRFKSARIINKTLVFFLDEIY